MFLVIFLLLHEQGKMALASRDVTQHPTTIHVMDAAAKVRLQLFDRIPSVVAVTCHQQSAHGSSSGWT